MKVIDLLNKIANGEEVPYKIRINDREYLYDKYSNWYFYGKTSDDMFINKDRLNEEVEILEEEKKIPDKLYKYMEYEDEGCYENILKVYDGGEYEIKEDMSFVIDKINEIIDYLKSKGE